jgi:YHS domain-containing protein
MIKRNTLVLFMVLAFALGAFSFALAGDQPAGAKGESTKAVQGRTAAHMHKPIANELAVCACGKVFTPGPETKYMEHNGKEYAFCSDGCYEKAMKDPAGVTKMADDNKAKLMTPPMPKK